MQLIDDEKIDKALTPKAMIDALARVFANDNIHAPERIVYQIALPNGGEASLLIMPVWSAGEGITLKAVTFFPDNRENDLPTIHAGVMQFDGANGRLLAAADGDLPTARRTAAASALAARYLSREDARSYLLIGTGQLAVDMVRAHHVVRDYSTTQIWGRDRSKAQAVVDELTAHGVAAAVADDLEMAVCAADVISTITSSSTPVVRGKWLKSGAHLDLVGSFRPDLRESDDAAITAGRLFVDSRAGAMRSGDLAQPMEVGVLSEADIAGDLRDLVRSKVIGRQRDDEITIFKSAGLSIEDYAAMQLVVDAT